ncbi:unnamed protein product [Soboliphyme baturini]|uniref:Transmembrane and coiled-coil domain-containing protein 4 n=1 Tax=Soboliphyme baturini TaxID=241478 RepID=A0A183IBG0_9BILA|nr:unnamed protein product [Soboliphyme baturini]
MGSLFGIGGAGFTGYKMVRRVGELEEFKFERMSEGCSLHMTIAVSGWINEEREDAFRWAWRYLALSEEQYCVRYESKYLLELGKAMNYLMSYVVNYAIEQALMDTAIGGIVSALAWPMALLTVANVIDNPWSLGNRPVTLLGFSLGARVIHKCLQAMAKRKGCEGIVEDVVLLGAPVNRSVNDWKTILPVVSGRIINGYSKSDWLLKFLYRTMNIQPWIAGIGPVENVSNKVSNIDLTDIVRGHLDYQHKLREVLEAIEIPVLPFTAAIVPVLPLENGPASDDSTASSRSHSQAT